MHLVKHEYLSCDSTVCTIRTLVKYGYISELAEYTLVSAIIFYSNFVFHHDIEIAYKIQFKTGAINEIIFITVVLVFLRKFAILTIMLMKHHAPCFILHILWISGLAPAPHSVWSYRQWGADLCDWKVKTQILCSFQMVLALMQFWTLAHTPQCRTEYDVDCNKQTN